MKKEAKKLDNPVYYSLTEIHQNFALEYNGITFYHPDYCPFGGFINPDNTSQGITKYAQLSDSFFVVGTKPDFDDSLKLNTELVCDQMLLYKPINIPITEEITPLQEEHRAELLALVNLVQPGYFKTKTPELGNYYGIYNNGKLVAVTGERMKMNQYTEISAVVTHPDFIGKGYASQLIAHATTTIFRENKIPYLHVAETNSRAIKVYENLGFTTRRKISFWNFSR